MYDDALTRNGDGELAVRTVQATGDNPASSYDDVFTRDENGKLAVRVVGGGGGGDVDTTKVVNKAAVLPTAGSGNVGKVYMYSGETDANYTHGYIYECQATTVYEDTTTFQPATLSGTVVTATSGAVADLCAEYITGDITEIVSGTMTYDQSGDLWVFVGKDAEDNTVGTFQLYQLDYEDAGFTFNGTPEDGDVVAFTCSITETTSYGWVRIDVQPAGSSDEHNLGWFADLTALQTAHPTGVDGDFAILGSTDTVWVWDSGTSAWKDTDQKGQVTSVNGQTGVVVLTASNVGAATTAQGAKADTAVQPGDLATVATSGSYNDLSDKPTIPAAQVNSDWDAVSGVAQILNKPTIPTVGNGTITITQGGVTKGTFTTNQGGDTTIDVDADTGQVIQVTTLPTAGADELGNIYQFVGTTDTNYTNGYFYKCVSDGQDPATYSWTAVEVQASSGGLPSQTGNDGKFLTTDGTDVSWGDALVNKAATSVNNTTLFVSNTTTGNTYSNSTIIGMGAYTTGVQSVAVGTGASGSRYGVAVGRDSGASADYAISIGRGTRANAAYAIQIGEGQNSDANTFKVGNTNGNFEMMSADGTIPAARHASLPSADGTYVLKLVISGGVPTLSWVAE